MQKMTIRDRAKALVTKATGRKHQGYPVGIARNDNGPPCKRCGQPCDLFAPGRGYIHSSCD